MKVLFAEQTTPEEKERKALSLLDEILKCGELFRAKQYCELVLGQYPFHVEFNFHLGNIENLLGNYESAKATFTLAHRYSVVVNPRTLFNIGYVCFRLNDYDLAISAYIAALKALKQEGEAQVDKTDLVEIYQNLGIAQACNAVRFIDTDPGRAVREYLNAEISFNNVMEAINDDILVSMHSELEANPELDQLEYLDRERAQNYTYGLAFINTLLILKDLIKLNAPDKDRLAKQLNEKLIFGLVSLAFVDHHREIQHIQWEWQQACGRAIDVDKILSDEIEHNVQEAVTQEARLQAILDWHREPVDWPALKQRYLDGMRYMYQLHTAHMTMASSQDEATPMSPLTKKYRNDPKENTPESIEVQEPKEDEDDPILAGLLAPRDEDKVNRLNVEITAELMGSSSHPHAFHIMLSSPEFLYLHGWYRFEGGRLGHVIHDSYTYFHELALAHIRHQLSTCQYRLQIAGFKMSENKWVAALAIINETIGQITGIFPNGTPHFVGDLTHAEEPDIQVKRRQDLALIAKFKICHTLFKAELLRGLVLQIMNNPDEATQSFDRCYLHIGVLESILKSPQHTETLRLLKDENRGLDISGLHAVVREYERKIPEKLRARIKCLEEILQQDPLRIHVNNTIIPFPYDMLRENFLDLNQQLGVDDSANVSGHVLSLCYLTADGITQVTSIHFNCNGMALDLFNTSRKCNLSFDAKAAVVSKINYGLQVYQALDAEKQALPSLAFMKHVKKQEYFNDPLNKHSEQGFYVALDRCDPNDLITQWSQASNGKFVPESTVILLASNIKTTKTGCPCCKASALATQRPKHDDNGAFLNRLHAALLFRNYKIAETQVGAPKLMMVTRIRAFSKDGHAAQHGLHQNPSEREVTHQNNLAVFEDLDSSSFVSGYRKGIF
jgi:tetratricopeptide (TPR) repeat protein